MTVTDLIKRHEGFSPDVYKCPAGKLTIGYGYNLEANPLKLKQADITRYLNKGITEIEAGGLLTTQLKQMEHELSGKLPWWSKLNGARQAVLLDMAYNLGVNGLLAFKKTLAFMARGEYTLAAAEMLASKWALQVKTRATNLACIMQTGKLT